MSALYLEEESVVKFGLSHLLEDNQSTHVIGLSTWVSTIVTLAGDDSLKSESQIDLEFTSHCTFVCAEPQSGCKLSMAPAQLGATQFGS